MRLAGGEGVGLIDGDRQVAGGSEFKVADNRVVSGLVVRLRHCAGVAFGKFCHRGTADSRGEVFREGPEARVMYV